MTAIADEIVAWASERAAWQRDLVARLAEQTRLSDDELDQVIDNLLAEHGGPPVEVELRAPAAAQFAGDPAAGAPRVRALEGLQHVNALAPGRRLEFAEDGLSVVYGENAAGKTGYCRVFKRVCRAVDTESAILRNVFEADSEEPQKATFEIVDADGSVTSEEIDLGAEPPEKLSAISVFDAECADNYVTEANTIAFTPEPLRIFDRIVRAQQAIRGHLESRIADLQLARPDLDEFDARTSVGSLIETLSADTEPTTVRAAAEMSTDEVRRVAEIRSIKGPDPAEKLRLARRADADASAGRRLAAALRSLADAVSEDFADRLARERAEAATKAEAAEVARTKAFGDQPIEKVGDAVWQELWEAARRFHEHSHEAAGSFPPLGHGDRCPLCLQTLDDEARERLTNFEEFVGSTTAAEAKAAAASVATTVSRLDEGLVAACRPDFLDVLRSDQAPLAKDVDAFAAVGEARMKKFLAGENAELDPLPDSPAVAVEDYAERREAYAAGLRDDKNQGAFDDELRELEATEQLAKRLDPILAWIEKLQRIKMLETAMASLGTRGVTTKQKALANEVITDGLRTALDEELQTLGMDDVSIALDSSGELGNTVVRLTFEGKAATHAPVQVLSQGEQRAAALAFFLAEVKVGGGDGGIILDDPVSSLDDPRRRSMASRLAAEAKKRQVVVFTHDLVFFVRLDQLGDADDELAYKVQRVWRGSDEIGLTSPDAPWPGQNVKARLGYLRRRIQEFPKAEELGPERFKREIKSWYEELRETWERAVEEVLFADVVQRFRPSVETQRLKGAPDLTMERRKAVEAGMDRCSAFAHDEAAAGEATKERMSEDLAAIEEFVDDIRKPKQEEEHAMGSKVANGKVS